MKELEKLKKQIFDDNISNNSHRLTKYTIENILK